MERFIIYLTRFLIYFNDKVLFIYRIPIKAKKLWCIWFYFTILPDPLELTTRKLDCFRDFWVNRQSISAETGGRGCCLQHPRYAISKSTCKCNYKALDKIEDIWYTCWFKYNTCISPSNVSVCLISTCIFFSKRCNLHVIFNELLLTLP